MSEKFGTEKPANDNRRISPEVAAEKERVATYIRIGAFRDAVSEQWGLSELKTNLLKEVSVILTELIECTISPEMARSRVKKLAADNGFPFDDTRPKT